MTTSHKSRTTKPDWRIAEQLTASRDCPAETIALIQARNAALIAARPVRQDTT